MLTTGEGRDGMNQEIRFDIDIHITMYKIASRKLPSTEGAQFSALR